MADIVENIPILYNTFTACMEVPEKCLKLRVQLQQISSTESDMIAQLKSEEDGNPSTKQKEYVRTLFKLIENFIKMATKTLEKHGGGGWWSRIVMVLKADNLLKEGEYLLSQADHLMKEGLTFDEVYTRGMKLPVEKFIGVTMKKLHEDALRSIKTRVDIIGIHGNLGAGKTNFMKALYNSVHDDHKHFKAVFWAGAPQEQQHDIKSLQECVAEAMKFKFEDEDVVRRSSLLQAKLKNMTPGHVILFVDNVKEQFLMDEVGIPIGYDEAENFCCTLVFTTSSEDVCNKMRCSTQFKMNLLAEDEARELFLHEARLSNTHCTRAHGRRMVKVANDVAKQCARVPFVITLIARSMTGKDDICEWKNRLNELKGIVEDLHGDEAKILEQLKFSLNCIKDHTIRVCFLDSASVLLEGHQYTRQKLIQLWVQNRRIGMKRRKVASLTTAVTDQGHTIINELQRAYLLEIQELDGTEYVSMNKWIRKMAMNILHEVSSHI